MQDVGAPCAVVAIFVMSIWSLGTRSPIWRVRASHGAKESSFAVEKLTLSSEEIKFCLEGIKLCREEIKFCREEINFYREEINFCLEEANFCRALMGHRTEVLYCRLQILNLEYS